MALAGSWGTSWEELGFGLTYAGVDWYTEAPRSGFAGSVDMRSARAVTPPRCPKCRTALEQRSRWPRGYRWACPGCAWSKKSLDDYYVVASRASAVIQREVELQHEAAEERGKADRARAVEELKKRRAEEGLDNEMGSLDDRSRPGGPHRS